MHGKQCTAVQSLLFAPVNLNNSGNEAYHSISTHQMCCFLSQPCKLVETHWKEIEYLADFWFSYPLSHRYLIKNINLILILKIFLSECIHFSFNLCTNTIITIIESVKFYWMLHQKSVKVSRKFSGSLVLNIF